MRHRGSQAKARLERHPTHQSEQKPGQAVFLAQPATTLRSWEPKTARAGSTSLVDDLGSARVSVGIHPTEPR